MNHAPRVILVTGATQGIGRYLVDHYLSLGDAVVGCGRGTSDVAHERYLHATLDVADANGAANLMKTVKERLGRLDVLINNAGIANMNVIALTPVDVVERMVRTNFVGVYVMTHAAFRLMKSSPCGRIVNLSTVAVPMRLEGEAIYAATKSAVETFTRITAKEFGKFGITCNAVGPSPIKTRLTQGVAQEKLDRLVKQQAIPKWAEPADVANVIDFFLRPESRLVTGQVLYLGGFG